LRASIEDYRHVCAGDDGAGDRGLLLDHYKVEVSADFISTVTDSVLEAVVE
jgi:hypothetical protein